MSTKNCKIDRKKKYECEEAYPNVSEESNKEEMFNVLKELGEFKWKCEEVAKKRVKQIIKKNYYRYKQKPHHCVIHRGEQPHLSLRTTNGERVNLVLFFRTVDSFPLFCDLPKSVKVHVLSFLDEKSIVNFRLTCKENKEVAENDFLWKIIYHKVFGEEISLPPANKKDDIICNKEFKIKKNDLWRTKYLKRRIYELKSITYPNV